MIGIASRSGMRDQPVVCIDVSQHVRVHARDCIDSAGVAAARLVPAPERPQDARSMRRFANARNDALDERLQESIVHEVSKWVADAGKNISPQPPREAI